MKLEVGMYVRGKYYRYRGKIGKIIKNYNGDLEIAYQDSIVKTTVSSFIDDNFDINGKQYIASHNIIDLIEVGDYVNGYKVSFKGDDYQPFVQCDYPVEEGSTNHYRFYEKAIYSIVTKEQFESMSYKVEV